MKTQDVYIYDSNFEIQAQGEQLIFPLLLVVFIFGLFMMSSPSIEKSPLPYKNTATATSSKTDSKKSIVDIIYSCTDRNCK